jgi:hypothetical protein
MKTTIAFTAFLIGFLMLMSACSSQKYAYLQKIKLDQPTRKKKNAEIYIGEISPKKAKNIPEFSNPTSIEKKPLVELNAKVNSEKLNCNLPVKRLVPTIGSQVFGSIQPLVTKTKEIKALIKKNQVSSDFYFVNTAKLIFSVLLLLLVIIIAASLATAGFDGITLIAIIGGSLLLFVLFSFFMG